MIQLTVAKTGAADFSSLQDAIDAISDLQVSQVKISLLAGIYPEVICIPPQAPAIWLVGEGSAYTKIIYNNFAGKLTTSGTRLGTGNSATCFINSNDFKAENISFINDYYEPILDAPGRQAVALNTIGERVQFINCSFIGYQDTLYVREGSCYFYNCFIAGDIDFIFGGATAVFNNCHIHSLYGGSATNNGYIAAASTRATQSYGFLFDQCHITADSNMPPHSVYLGRPWHPSSSEVPICSSMVYKNCYLGVHIKSEGWTSMGNIQPHTERLYEYNNHGPGSVDHVLRNQLTPQQATAHNIQTLLPWTNN